MKVRCSCTPTCWCCLRVSVGCQRGVMVAILRSAPLTLCFRVVEMISVTELAYDGTFTEVVDETEQDAMIIYEFPDAENEMLDFNFKAAIQISKAVRRMDLLKEYDTLHAKFKDKSSIKGYKPSSPKRKHYNKLLSSVHIQVLSMFKVEINTKPVSAHGHSTITPYFHYPGRLPCGKLCTKLVGGVNMQLWSQWRFNINHR